MAARSINHLLRISPRFLRSAQLERDFRDPDALGGYVLTHDMRMNLSRLLKGTRSLSGQRSWRVTGDFGSGKSSFALLLANLLSQSPTDLPKHLRGLPVEMGLTRSRLSFLPVLVTGSRQQMSLALLSALSNSLRQNIDGRKRLKVRMAVDEILSAPPKSNLDQQVIALLNQASSELRQHELFNGVLVVIDELGKFLEYSALNPEKQDVYFLQQLGEASSRSGENNLFTVGLLHQGFSTYADKLSEQAQREWDKVAERFEEIVFAQPLSQVAALLCAALNVKEDECPRGWKAEAHSDMRTAVELGLFGANAGKGALVDLAPSLYPLHPTVVPVLAKFFRRFGQNERSLFSFLLSSEPHALQDFAQNEANLSFIYRLPEFYDFIAQNFGSRLSAQSFRSHWSYIDAVIRSFPTEREADLRVLKTVAVLNTIDSTAELLPNDELLALALGKSSCISDSIARLKKQNLLFFRGARRGYALWSHASVNLEQEFAKASESIQQVSNMGELLRTRLDARPVVARAHYIKTGNLRHFNLRFCSADELTPEQTFQPEHPADGLIVIVLSETGEQKKRAQKMIAGLPASPQVMFGVTEALEVLHGLILTLERWSHVERHTPELKDDRFAAEEVSRQIAHANQALEGALHRYVGFRGLSKVGQSSIHWFYDGKPLKKMERDGSLQSYLSELCDRLFPHAPHVHNELVNRNTLSSAAAAARQRLFELMLNHENDPHLGLPQDKAPPERSLYLSVLKQSGVHAEREHGWSIEFPERDPLRLRTALEHVIRMLEAQSEARVRVDQIISELRRPPFGVRDGLIPILLVATYVQHEAEIAIYEDGRFVSDVEAFLMMRLVKAPQTFEFQLCRIDGMRKELLTHLAEVLRLDRAEHTELLSIVRPICVMVAKLPEYARNTDTLSAKALALRKHVLAAEEPAALVFKAIPEALGFKGDVCRSEASKLASKLAQCLSELHRALPECRKRMTESVLEAFGEPGADFAAWRRTMAGRAETVVVGVTNPELRAFTLKFVDDATEESVWLEALGSLVTRVPPSRWRDRDETAFREGILGLVKQFRRVESLHFSKGSQAPENAVRIALTQKTGEERDQVFHLNAAQAKEALALRKHLQSHMPEDKKLAVAALSQLLWEMLAPSS